MMYITNSGISRFCTNLHGLISQNFKFVSIYLNGELFRIHLFKHSFLCCHISLLFYGFFVENVTKYICTNSTCHHSLTKIYVMWLPFVCDSIPLIKINRINFNAVFL